MKKVAIFALLFLPSIAFGAGFAHDPIFLSRTPVTEGQSVHVYAVLNNADAAPFDGTVVFYDGTSKLGSVSVNLAAGASQTVSIAWTPAAGSHTIKADLVGANSSIAEEINSTFSVTAKTSPASAHNAAATIDSSAGIQQGIAGFSPEVASTTEPVFTVIDGARNSAADALDSQIAATKAKISNTPKPGIVAGAATEDAQVQNPTTGFWYWLYTIYLWALEALRWLVGSAGVFYPFIAIVFLYVLWRLYRRFRRPY